MDEPLKQRLVGAAVLVLLAAIFVPMVFDSTLSETPGADGRDGERRAEDGDFRSSVVPVGEVAGTPRGSASDFSRTQPAGPAPAPSRPAAERPSAAPAQQPPEDVAVAPEPEPQADARPEAGAAPRSDTGPRSAPDAGPVPAAGGWVVQVASFSDFANANVLVARLVAQGYDAFSLQASVSGRTVVRVYAGPTPDKAQSQSLAEKVEKSFKLKGLVVRNPA